MKRIVIKIGTNLLLEGDRVRKVNLDRLVASISRLGCEKIIVSSGAVALGNSILQERFKHEDDVMRNVAATIGQAQLMEMFRNSFAGRSEIGQLLLTQNDISNRSTFLRVREVMESMLKKGIIPIINENDSIKDSSNKFRDNDYLAIKIASKMEADQLILLTNVGGVYTADPREYSDAKLIRVLEESDLDRIQIGSKSSQQSMGGMDSKIESAMLSSKLGIRTVIANGNSEGVLEEILCGNGSGTVFRENSRVRSKQRWIILTKEKGQITIDDGAYRAMTCKRSLLAVGVRSVAGQFQDQDVVRIICENKTVGKAIVDCSSDTLRFIAGRQTKEIKEVLSEHNCVARHENIVLK